MWDYHGAPLKTADEPAFTAATWRALSLNYQLRKVTKNRGHFPNDDAVVKLLWLAICNIEDKRARAREKEKGGSRETTRKAEGRLVEGQVTTNWKQALAQLSMVYPDRINRHL